MNFEKEDFEKKGLKFNKDRVLTYSQLSCPSGCKYCFVENMNYNQKKDVAYLSDEQLDLISQLPDEITTIMLGCDTEFFQAEENSLEILSRLSKLNKDISIVTKLQLSEDFIKKLKGINEKLITHKNFLTLSISLTSMKSAKEWEPGVPDPSKRIETLKMVHDAGIKTLVALRPLLPTVPDREIEEIIELTKDCCHGYYSGPLYLKTLDLLENMDKSNLNIERLQPHWMPEENIFYKVEREGQMEVLKGILEKHKKPIFEGAAEGIKFLRNL